MTRRSSVAAGAVIALFIARQGRGEVPAESLDPSTTPFEVPAGCGSREAFREELEGLVGADAGRAWPSSLSIAKTAAPEAAAASYHLTIEVRGAHRELDHQDCRVLFRSALVIAAASVKEETSPAFSPVPAATPPTASTAAATVITPPDSRPSAPHGEAHERLRGNLAAGAGVALGVVPGATVAFEIRGGAELGKLGASISGRYFFPRFVAVEGRGADIEGFGLRAAVGYAPLSLLAFSVGFDADWLLGQGTSGIALPLEDSAWTLGPSLELQLIPIRTRHLTLEVGVSGRLALQRPTFEVTGFKDLYQVPPVGMVALARGVFHFP